MTQLTDVKACVFDAYGTLFDVHAAAAQCRDLLHGKADPISATWRQKQLEYSWLRSLMDGYTDFWTITQDALDYALSAHNLINPAVRERLLGLYWELSAYKEVPRTLAALQEGGFKTAILSNGSPDMLSAAVRSAGLAAYLDAVQSVDRLKIYKPHPSVYQLSVDQFNVEPRKICFLSSNAWDVAGAAHFGFQVVWVNRFANQPERLPGKPKSIMTDLRDLPQLLGLD